MTAYTPAYRLTVYEPRSAQSAVTEPDILTATSPHTDAFKVASISGVSGFHPYLGTITGRRGKIDPLTKKVTTGQLTIRLLDAKTGTSNLQRWVTAFLGNAQGRNQLLGCKVYLEESLDGGSTWSPYFVGRIDSTQLDDPLWYSLTVRDFADDLEMDVFVGRPNAAVTYAAEPLLLPLGLSDPYGVLAASDPLSGTFEAASYTSAGFRVLTLDTASRGRSDNYVTAALYAQDTNLSTSNQGPHSSTNRASDTLRLRFTSTSPSLTDKELRPVKFIYAVRSDKTAYVTQIMCEAVDSTDLYYTAFDTTTVPNATTCTFTVRQVQYNDVGEVREDPNSNAPLYLTDQNPMQVWQDVLDGYFGRQYQSTDALPTGKSIGDPVRAVPYTAAASSAFDKLASATNRDPLPQCRFRLTKPMTAREFFEKTGQFLGLSYRMEPALNGSVPECRFVPVDMRLPTAAAISGITTITDADIDTSALPTWEQNRTDAVTQIQVDWYEDARVDTSTLSDLSKRPFHGRITALLVPEVSVSLLDEVPNREVWWDFGRALDLGDRTLTIDAFGLRGTAELEDTVESLHVESYAQRQAQRVVEFYRSQFGSGPMTLAFQCRRTSNTSSLWPGDWVYLDVDVVPDPATNVRGGTRLVQVLERQEQGLTIAFTALDAGAGASCAVPTIGTPTQTSGATAHSIDVGVTLNAASEPVEVRTNIQATSYGTTPPADTDDGWVYATRVTTSSTAVIRGLPSGVRVFVQGRSVPKADGSADSPKLPSAWTSPSGTKYVDTAALTAPSSVVVLPATILSNSTITVTWTNGTDSLPVYVSIWDSGGTTLLANVGVFVAGSVGPVELNGYVGSSATYTVKVAHLDELGGRSPYGSTTFTTPSGLTGGTLTAPTLSILQGKV